MSKSSFLLSKFLPSPSENIENVDDFERGYKYFSRGLTLLLAVLVLVPLTIISLLSHYQYKHLLHKNELTQLVLNLEQAQSTLERFVAKLQSIIKFVARDDRYNDLLDPDNLEALFIRLQQEHPDFADIEIIDSEGNQQSYFGPYQLEAQNYQDQTWYQEVLLRGVYISNVFSGFRQVPHFVIAVSRKHPGQEGSWVLRVTIDGKTLQRFVDTISTPSVSDIFLIDANWIAQTQPQKYGAIGEVNMLYDIEKKENDILESVLLEHREMAEDQQDIIVQKVLDGQDILHASVRLENTPWRLDIVKEFYLQGQAWSSFRVRLITIFGYCAVVAVILILKISSGITNHIREADRKRQQFLAEVENANKLASIGRLAAGVAHEINNPLSIINQKTGLVQDYIELTGDFEYKESMRGALDGIQNSVVRCKTITHRLLGFARHTDVRTEELDINVVLQEVVAFLAQEATYSQIQICFDLDQSIQKIYSDRSQLQQVFLNITNNAIDAIGSNGHITISSRTVDEKTIQINIVDDGSGMSSEVVRRIFDPFFTTKETGKGTGLGLSITYGILKKLGGTIRAESEVGVGTTFEITLPVNRS
ncbi:MAG: sensor histidine kinase [Desulforhopalus sp.]